VPVLEQLAAQLSQWQKSDNRENITLELVSLDVAEANDLFNVVGNYMWKTRGGDFADAFRNAIRSKHVHGSAIMARATRFDLLNFRRVIDPALYQKRVLEKLAGAQVEHITAFTSTPDHWALSALLRLIPVHKVLDTIQQELDTLQVVKINA
jgi:hypothetical protein